MTMKPISLAAVTVIVGCMIGLIGEDVLGGSAVSSGEKIVKWVCVQCHRIEGKTRSAPDEAGPGLKHFRRQGRNV
jgi:cytochrome c2